ncbi:hypothetical protein [Haloferula sp.]|uniref:hypothetical protein n=1 Tax=Haloferula sp. TaxID=2497595 RepID=UPI003C714A54
MESELQELEAQLQGIRPAALDDALLDRLTGAVAGTLQQVDGGLRSVEAAATRVEPAALSSDLTARLEKVVQGVPFPVDEKVVLFPRGVAPVESGEVKKISPKWWAAAAAVALAGGLSALMVSPPKETSKKIVAAPAQINSGAFVPAGFNSGVSGTDDLGVMWTDQQKPVRVVRVVYKDVLRLLNNKGEEVEVEVPRVEYLMVPEKID